MAGKVKWLAVIAILAVLGSVGYGAWQKKQKDDSDLKLGLEAARVLSESFERAPAIQVARLKGRIVARSEAKCGPFGILQTRQQTAAPYEVIYTVDLKGLSRSAYRWNAEVRTMTVEVPSVKVGRPSINMEEAKISQDGVYICRLGGIEMQRMAAQRLRQKANERANDPENLKGANDAARSALGDMVNAPLAASGVQATVLVRLAGDPQPALLTREQWDVSRSLDEVYRDFVD